MNVLKLYDARQQTIHRAQQTVGSIQNLGLFVDKWGLRVSTFIWKTRFINIITLTSYNKTFTSPLRMLTVTPDAWKAKETWKSSGGLELTWTWSCGYNQHQKYDHSCRPAWARAILLSSKGARTEQLLCYDARLTSLYIGLREQKNMPCQTT